MYISKLAFKVSSISNSFTMLITEVLYIIFSPAFSVSFEQKF